MTNPNKRRGDHFEAAIRDHCCANGFPDCKRTRAGYARDEGDLHLDPLAGSGVSGGGVIIQCKNQARIELPGWLGELAEQVDESKAAHGFLVVKRRRVGDPGRSYAVCELDRMLVLVRAAGYGTPLTSTLDALGG